MNFMSAFSVLFFIISKLNEATLHYIRVSEDIRLIYSSLKRRQLQANHMQTEIETRVVCPEYGFVLTIKD